MLCKSYKLRGGLVIATGLVAALLFSAGCGGGGGGRSSITEPLPPSDLFAAVGCSQTVIILASYHEFGGNMGWPAEAIHGYGGGDFLDWANLSDSRWLIFQSALETYGANRIWWEICVTGGRSDTTPTATDLDAAQAVLDEIKRRAPGIPVIISALTVYEPHDLCPKAGAGGPPLAQGIRDHFVATGEAELGPELGPLDASLMPADPKDCAPNEFGRELLGNQLIMFFGG